MPVLTDGPHTADFILSEGPGYYSRDQITVDTGVLVPGTVLGKITATGKFVILAPAAVDGSQTAAGVLIYGCDAVAADQVVAGLTRDSEVNGLKITWPGGITNPQKVTATAQLAALGIVIR